MSQVGECDILGRRNQSFGWWHEDLVGSPLTVAVRIDQQISCDRERPASKRGPVAGEGVQGAKATEEDLVADSFRVVRAASPGEGRDLGRESPKQLVEATWIAGPGSIDPRVGFLGRLHRLRHEGDHLTHVNERPAM